MLYSKLIKYMVKYCNKSNKITIKKIRGCFLFCLGCYARISIGLRVGLKNGIDHLLAKIDKFLLQD